MIKLTNSVCVKGFSLPSLNYFSGSGSSQQLARGLLTTSVGKVVIKLLINDIEMDARECTNKGTFLCQKQYQDLKNFQWENIVGELVSKQSLLSEVLLALACPTD